MKYCDFNGCGNKIERGAYCDEHKRKRRKRKQANKNIYHSENKPFYRSGSWQFIRSQVYERERGLCQRCKFPSCSVAVPISQDVTLKLEPNNLRLLCPKCHIIEENEGEKKVFPSYFN